MLSVIIPTEGIEQPTVATLAALVPGAAAGVVREVLLVDRSGDRRHRTRGRCRGLPVPRLRRHARRGDGGRRAPGPRALADVPACGRRAGFRLDRRNHAIHPGCRRTADAPAPAIFRYARSPYADTRLRDGFKFVARLIAGPSAEQGLLIARDHYERLGGYAPDARRSEARLLRQLGRSSRTLLRSRIMVA